MKNLKPKLVEYDRLAKKPAEYYTNTSSLTSEIES
jgi:hypothetical protein